MMTSPQARSLAISQSSWTGCLVPLWKYHIAWSDIYQKRDEERYLKRKFTDISREYSQESIKSKEISQESMLKRGTPREISQESFLKRSPSPSLNYLSLEISPKSISHLFKIISIRLLEWGEDSSISLGISHRWRYHILQRENIREISFASKEITPQARCLLFSDLISLEQGLSREVSQESNVKRVMPRE